MKREFWTWIIIHGSSWPYTSMQALYMYFLSHKGPYMEIKNTANILITVNLIVQMNSWTRKLPLNHAWLLIKSMVLGAWSVSLNTEYVQLLVYNVHSN